jgi:hypothetical protein
MKWEQLEEGDLLIPLKDFKYLEACAITQIRHDYEIIRITFLNLNSGNSFEENRYRGGSAGIGFDIIRDGKIIY